MDRVKARTEVCRNILGKSMIRGERLIEFDYSWLSPKFILVKGFMF